jgi:manganese oxidase
MGHDLRNLIGVSKKDLAKAVGKFAPDAMVMGSTGMAMGEMEIPAPDNTLPMMTGSGPFGPIVHRHKYPRRPRGMITAIRVRTGIRKARSPTRALAAKTVSGISNCPPSWAG